ncbi:MAG: hypothetical protein SGILL_005628 [Bacillariaceae sp.]
MRNEFKTSSKSKGQRKTREEQEFQVLCESFETTLTRVSDMTSKAVAESQELQDEIEKLQSVTQQARAKLLDVDASLSGRKKELAFLLSRRTDVSRQIEEARKLIESVTQDSSASNLVENQPLDRSSEQTRRQIKAEMLYLKKRLSHAEWRINLLEKAGNDHEDCNQILCREISGLYRMLKDDAPKTIKSIEEQVGLASRSIPHSQLQLRKKSQGRSTYCLDEPTPRKRHTMREVQIQSRSATRSRNKMSPKEMVTGWRNTERFLQQLECRTDKFNDLNSGFRRSTKANAKETPRRRMAPSSLMSPDTGSFQQSSSSVPPSAVRMFTPPSATKARDGWDKPSTMERDRMRSTLSAGAPRDLIQTTLTEASRPTLSSIGSTPEKLQAALDLKNSTFTSQASTSAPSAKKSSSAAAFPPTSSKAPSKPFSAAAKSPPKPPASSTKPTATVAALPTSKATTGSAFPPASKVAPKPFSTGQGSGTSDGKVQAADSTRVSTKKDSSSIGFGNMAGLADSLNAGSEKTSDLSTSSGIPTSETPGSSGGNSGKDYKTLLTSFYQQADPSKTPDHVSKLLDRYKGREEEVFAKLKQRYGKFAYLLDGPSGQQGMTSAPAPAPTPASFSTFGNSGSSAPAQSSFTTAPANAAPFGATGGSGGSSETKTGVQAQSSFGATNISASKSPFSSAPTSGFGGMAASSSPFGGAPPASSSSPFGAAPATSSSSPFGSSSAAGAPFGSQAGGLAGASPFGTPAPAPFGAPAPASTQSGVEKLFNGKTARQILTEIYQQKDPSKLSMVDHNVKKYHNQPELMLSKVATKVSGIATTIYNIDPTLLGLPAQMPAASPATPFGSPAQAAAPAFGQASAMGGGPSPFGQSGGGFGQPSQLGGGGGTPGRAGGGHAFGSAAGSGFGASNFGSLAQSSSPSPFGAPSPGFGGGNSGGFGSPAPQGFGSQPGASPFGPARR